MAHIRKNMLSFFLTTQCNLDCAYCYTNKTSRPVQTLSLPFARAGIDDFFARSESRHIRFFGAGEPTCALGLMKEIRQYALERSGGKPLLVETQTNGCFPRSTADWLAEHVDVIWVSSDGTPETQDYYRRTLGGKPTSANVAENVRYLARRPMGVTGVRATITTRNVHKQKDILEYFGGLGVRAVWSDPVFPSVGQRAALDAPSLVDYVESFLGAHAYAAAHNMFYGSILTCNFDEDTDQHCRACLPCPHLTTDGFVSACDMALFGADDGPMSVFIYGRWDPSAEVIRYDESRIQALQRRRLAAMPGCVGCEARDRCGGYCLGEVVNETGSLVGQKVHACEAIRELFRRLPTAPGLFPHLHP